MKKLLLALLLATISLTAFAQQKNVEFNYVIETKHWTAQPILTYEIGTVNDLFSIKHLDFKVISLVGYDSTGGEVNAGGGFVFPIPIAKNMCLNLGGRIAFQINKQPEFAFIGGIVIKF